MSELPAVNWGPHDVLITHPDGTEVALRTGATPSHVLDAVIEAMSLQAMFPGEWDGDIVIRRSEADAEPEPADAEEVRTGDGVVRSLRVPPPGGAVPGGGGGPRDIGQRSWETGGPDPYPVLLDPAASGPLPVVSNHNPFPTQPIPLGGVSWLEQRWSRTT